MHSQCITNALLPDYYGRWSRSKKGEAEGFRELHMLQDQHGAFIVRHYPNDNQHVFRTNCSTVAEDERNSVPYASIINAPFVAKSDGLVDTVWDLFGKMENAALTRLQ